VAPLLPQVRQPTLIIWGEQDRILSDVAGSMRAAAQISGARQVVIPQCGHAPQIEKARLVNQLVVRFLKDSLRSIPPALEPARFLEREERRRLGRSLAFGDG
jgi:alpha-beta hydrolase superfamily lysophospholipase